MPARPNHLRLVPTDGAANTAITHEALVREWKEFYATPDWTVRLLHKSLFNERVSAMASDEELTNAKIAAAEARTDTKITRMEGKMDLILSKLEDVREDNRHTRNNQILIGVSLALLIIGVVAAAPVIFDLGSKFRETITKEIQEQLAKPPHVPPSNK